MVSNREVQMDEEEPPELIDLNGDIFKEASLQKSDHDDARRVPITIVTGKLHLPIANAEQSLCLEWRA